MQPTNPAVAALLSFHSPMRSLAESIVCGVNTPNTLLGALASASVDPTFTQVRLARRAPVRTHVEHIPDTVTIAAGMTAIVTASKDAYLGP